MVPQIFQSFLLARMYFFQEEYDICGQLDILDDLYLHEDDELVPDDEDQRAGGTVDDIVHTCCTSFAEEESKLRDMKHWYKQIEGGTTVEYICPSCRECSKCKNSDTTEKISLREEVEQKAVEDSVHFDRENKKVMVELPKRGEEDFFLTSDVGGLVLHLLQRGHLLPHLGQDVAQDKSHAAPWLISASCSAAEHV